MSGLETIEVITILLWGWLLVGWPLLSRHLDKPNRAILKRMKRRTRHAND